jgi:CRP-like cAMP-binding protein
MILSEAEIEVTQNASVFRGIQGTEFDAIIKAAKIRKLDDNGFFFMEEEPAERAYVLLEGKVKLIQVTADGQQVILGYLVPGRVFGIIAILEEINYPVSAQAVGKCRALWWDQATLNVLMEKTPRLALNAMRIMVGQIREFQNTVKDLSTKRVEQRIARAILRLARQSGRKTEAGIRIELPLSRQDLAEMTGTTLYTVSRILTEWESRALIKSKRQEILICYPHGLVEIAEDLPRQQREQKIGPILKKCDL